MTNSIVLGLREFACIHADLNGRQDKFGQEVIHLIALFLS